MADPFSWLAALGSTGGATLAGVGAEFIGSTAAIGSAASSAFSIGSVLSSVGSGLGILGAVSDYQSAKEATEYNSRLAAEQYAQTAVEMDQALEQQRRAYRLSSGANIAKAAAGEGGVSGSAFDLLADNASQNALDMLTIKQNAAFSRNKIVSDERISRRKTSPSLIGTGAKILSSTRRGIYGSNGSDILEALGVA